ncbi:inverse autotransporter beta domain-containing protein [Xenorhabdus hominickii]|uniref:Invasin n=1 Tax=Xenorhabdus hominickii TaxID=351679 RepID=A0A2G0QDZ3_XENHO|nr:inverse autotransporter beta domain-containing protein [Xenorhabdus hominickii]AOM41512.1 invasin [Xenorhabdus hominickii]PHM57455.1 putative invasin [Xenorhabdus hominickii]
MNKKFDKPWLHNQQYLLKRVAWVNIITQIVLPAASAFTPVIATAKTHTTSQNENLVLPTEPYILASGETVNIIAKRYDLTVSDLKEINQLRTFSKPFMALGIGDEIDIPKPRHNKFLPFNYAQLNKTLLDKTSTTDKSSLRLAEAASQVGQLLTNDNIGDNAVNRLSNLAIGETNRQIQDWLGRYGTTRVQVNVDRHGHLSGSQFDMLLPLYNTNNYLAFTQLGLRRIDERNTVNIGLGQRHFFSNWMLGYNAFLDHDFTGNNTRLGVGAEYARNYLKLGANGYLRLSDWKESRLLTDYDERPANGFDLRVQGYLPVLPQLGGSLIYEQYFGNEVGLINKDHRRKNPSAFTAGINYTPIPLLTFGIDHRQETSGSGETSFNLTLNYEIGTPWSKQIDPDAVAFNRTLQGSRYDLVERNNQIVLEYRKREVISLIIDNLVVGYAGDTKAIHIRVNSKYGLKDIQWDVKDLLINGGKIKHKGGTNYQLLLPKYQSQGNNTYTVGAIAYDERGNASKRVEMQVQVLNAEVSADKSTFTTKDKEMLADGHSNTLLTLILKDKHNAPISGMASKIKLVTSGLSGEGSDPKIAKMKETQPGVYESLLTSGEKIGVMKITPEVDGLNIKPVEVLFVHPDAPLVRNLAITGKLEMGQKLSATYTFNANHGDKTDKSRYIWGNKGSTDVTKGNTITESGKIPNYTLTQEDAGRVKEVAVQAQNAMGLIGNTQTVDTSMDAELGNHTHDSGKGGSVRGLADNIIVTMSADKVKRNEPITLKVKTLNHGQLVRNVAIRVQAIKALNRQDVSQKISVLLNGELKQYQDFSDDQGMLSISVTDPNGLGVKTTLSVKADGSVAPESKDAIFTVITSPDVPSANFWGHMAETITLNGVTFRRPQLQTEADDGSHKVGHSVYPEHGEVWHRRTHEGALFYCRKLMNAQLPTKDELISLSQTYPDKIQNMFGWPDHRAYRSSTPGTDPNGEQGREDKGPVTGHYSMTIDRYNPHVIRDTTFDYVSCKS